MQGGNQNHSFGCSDFPQALDEIGSSPDNCHKSGNHHRISSRLGPAEIGGMVSDKIELKREIKKGYRFSKEWLSEKGKDWPMPLLPLEKFLMESV